MAQLAPKLDREMKKHRNEAFEFTVRDITFFDKAQAGGPSGGVVDEMKSGGWAALGCFGWRPLLSIDGSRHLMMWGGSGGAGGGGRGETGHGGIQGPARHSHPCSSKLNRSGTRRPDRPRSGCIATRTEEEEPMRAKNRTATVLALGLLAAGAARAGEETRGQGTLENHRAAVRCRGGKDIPRSAAARTKTSRKRKPRAR